MKFYDRERELAALEDIHSRKGKRMVSLSGRRRVGKTRLALEFIKDKHGTYFFVERKGETPLLQEFSETVRKLLPGKTVGRLSWEDFFTIIFDEMDVVVLDEFQNFTAVNPAIYTTLQKVWDGNDFDVTILLLGSYVGLMKGLFENYKSPLYGRTVGRMTLHPFGFATSANILKDMGFKDFDDMVRGYCILGGVPKYYEFLELLEIDSWQDIITRLFVRKPRPLVDEPEVLLVGEFGKNHGSYLSILDAVAHGKATMTEISDYAGINPKSMGKYLQELTEFYELLERRIPIFEGAKSKKGRYFLKDNLMAFWFRYVRPNHFLVEREKERRFLETVSETLNDFIGRRFEEIAREALETAPPFELDDIGPWWNRSGDEIDIVAANRQTKEILFGEVKWRNRKVGWKTVEELRKKSELVKWDENGKRTYLVISRAGFTNQCLEEMDSEGVLHWDRKDLVKALGIG